MTSYAEFLAAKAQLVNRGGFDPDGLPAHLFPFQRDLTAWAVQQGRAALFADCGLGKTPMELAWAEQVHRHTGRPVLLLTPLAVGFQIVAEAEKFGHDAALSRDGRVTSAVTVTNYEQIDKFDSDRFAGVVCDESSAIKAFDGTRRAQVTEFMRRIPYRLLGTATAPITHPYGFTNGYAGSEPIPADLLKFRAWTGDQKANRYSHWIWRRYASSVWDDVRIDRVLPFRDARDEDDEKHVHPLQLDVIERFLDMRTLPGETVLTPFMGVGSEVYSAVRMGRRGVGAELKPSYYEQARRNLEAVDSDALTAEAPELFADATS